MFLKRFLNKIVQTFFCFCLTNIIPDQCRKKPFNVTFWVSMWKDALAMRRLCQRGTHYHDNGVPILVKLISWFESDFSLWWSPYKRTVGVSGFIMCWLNKPLYLLLVNLPCEICHTRDILMSRDKRTMDDCGLIWKYHFRFFIFFFFDDKSYPIFWNWIRNNSIVCDSEMDSLLFKGCFTYKIWKSLLTDIRFCEEWTIFNKLNSDSRLK